MAIADSAPPSPQACPCCGSPAICLEPTQLKLAARGQGPNAALLNWKPAPASPPGGADPKGCEECGRAIHSFANNEAARAWIDRQKNRSQPGGAAQVTPREDELREAVQPFAWVAVDQSLDSPGKSLHFDKEEAVCYGKVQPLFTPPVGGGTVGER